MKGIKTHKSFGNSGVHPPEMKLTAGSIIKDMPLPRRVEISLCQSLGKPAVATVKPGDHVSRFDRIGEAQGAISANLHSPISGTVKSVGILETTDGQGAPGIVIEADDYDHNTDLQTMCDATPIFAAQKIAQLTPTEIIERIKNAGIVGLGGATFPTAVKLTPSSGSKPCDYLLINGAECEPYLTCDDAIMREMPNEIIVGIGLLLRALGENVKCIIGIEDNKPEALKSMRQAAYSHENISVVKMKTKYPQGGEKMLTKTLTGREIAPGKLPITEGVIIQNVATALAVYHAVIWGIPLVERVMTISGGKYNPRCNLRVPIGTLLTDIIDYLGPVPESTIKIISGGTMMGRALAGIQGSTTKGMSGLLLLDNTESPTHEETACVRCTKCVQVCPMGLEPYLLARLSELGRAEDLKKHNVMDCMECGCCSYGCMAHRRLADWIKVGKSMVRNLVNVK